MTDAQIEAIARLYCAKLGLDPGPQLEPLENGTTMIARQSNLSIAMWQLRGYLSMQEAIAEVRATVTEGEVRLEFWVPAAAADDVKQAVAQVMDKHKEET